MKRALFVSAGTVAGLVASLSYTPAFLTPFASGNQNGSLEARHAKALKVKDVANKEDKEQASGDAKKKSQKKSDTKKSGTKKDGSKSGGGGKAKASGGAGNAKASGGGTSAATNTTQPSSQADKTKDKPAANDTKTSKPKPTPSATPKPATFVGSVASTPFGPVQVSITVLDGRITDAKAVQYPKADPKSVEIANKCLPKLRSETLAAQSANIAVVSGASYTSDGWITSLESALSKAKL